MFGSWPSFPRSPQPWYEMLAAQFDVDGRHSWDGWATRDMAYEIAEAEQELAARARGDAAGLLAVRRAALTLYHEAAEVCDDSYGGLGDVASEAISLYARAGWRASGIASQVFWRDLLRWCVTASNYGLLDGLEIDLLGRAEIKRDLDLVEAILTELMSDYTTARMDWHAEEALQLRGYAVVAAGALDRFQSAAAAIGSHNRAALTAMVDAAVERGHVAVATGLLDAADVPGRHREWVRQRRTEFAEDRAAHAHPREPFRSEHVGVW